MEAHASHHWIEPGTRPLPEPIRSLPLPVQPKEDLVTAPSPPAPAAPPGRRPKTLPTPAVPSGLLTPLVTRPPALEPPATAMFRRAEPGSRAIVFPELPFPPDPASAPGPRLAVAEADPFAPTATSRSALPDPAVHARRLVLAALEAIYGRRPVQQLMPHLTDAAYRRLISRLQHARHTPTAGAGRRPAAGAVTSAPAASAAVHATNGVGPGPRARGHAVLRADRRGASRTRIHVGRAIVCEPADGVAEATVLARWGGRTRAVAVRLEGIDGRWRCPVLAIL